MYNAARAQKLATSGLSLGLAGVLVQVLLIYLVTRDRLVTSAFLTHVVPIAGSVQFRAAIALLLAWIAIGTRGLGPNSSAFGPWGWIVLGSFALFVMAEGVVTITAGGLPKGMVIVLIDTSIVLFALAVAYLFAARTMKTPDVLRFLLRPYCYLAIIVAVIGLAAWMLLYFGVVDPLDWRVPRGVLKKDALSPTGEYYTMPYYTSLILYDTAGAVFFGVDFKRASGLFQEPNQVAFFVTPALFLLPLVIGGRANGWKLWAIYSVLFAFLFVTHSVANLIVLTVVGLIVLGKIAFTHPSAWVRPIALFSLLLLVVVAWVALNTPGTIRSKFEQQGLGYFETVLTKLEESSLLDSGVLAPPKETIRHEDTPRQGLLSLFAFMFHVGVLVVLGLRMLLSRSPHWYLGGALVYMALHLIKGPGQFGASGFHLYMLFVTALALACYWRTPLSEKRGITPGKHGYVHRLGGSRPVA